MRLMLSVLLALPMVLSGCRSATEQRRKLDLLSSVTVAGTDTVAITRIEKTPFFLVSPEGKQVRTASIAKGETFVLSDGHHVSFTYRFSGLESGKAVFQEEERTDTRSMGGTVKTVRRRVAVAPYPSGDEAQAEPRVQRDAEDRAR